MNLPPEETTAIAKIGNKRHMNHISQYSRVIYFFCFQLSRLTHLLNTLHDPRSYKKISLDFVPYSVLVNRQDVPNIQNGCNLHLSLSPRPYPEGRARGKCRGQEEIRMKCIFGSIVMALAVVTGSAAGDIYNWKDENGVQHFSNSPVTSQSNPQSPVQVGKETNYVAPPEPHSEKKSSGNARDSRYEKQSYKTSEYEVQTQNPRKTHRRHSRQKSTTPPYDINWSSPTTGASDTIVLSGRVSGGNFCKKLLISVHLVDDYGHKAHIYCEANDVGGSGSRIATGSTRTKYHGQNWKVIKQSASCMIKQ